jgi:hypothetical protein
MKTIFKLTMICTGIVLASLFSTTTAKVEDPSNPPVDYGPGFSGCLGEEGTCGITTKGTKLVGKWVEI